MNCPYCKKPIRAFSGLQEAVKFQTHLNKCRKRPVTVTRNPTLMDALVIRADSGQ